MNVLGSLCSVKFVARPAAIALLWFAAAAVFAVIGPVGPALAESEITVGEQTFNSATPRRSRTVPPASRKKAARATGSSMPTAPACCICTT